MSTEAQTSPQFLAWIACSDSYNMPTTDVESIKNYIVNELPSYALPWARGEAGNGLDTRQQAFMAEIHENIEYSELYELMKWIFTNL